MRAVTRITLVTICKELYNKILHKQNTLNICYYITQKARC